MLGSTVASDDLSYCDELLIETCLMSCSAACCLCHGSHIAVTVHVKHVIMYLRFIFNTRTVNSLTRAYKLCEQHSLQGRGELCIKNCFCYLRLRLKTSVSFHHFKIRLLMCNHIFYFVTFVGDFFFFFCC